MRLAYLVAAHKTPATNHIAILGLSILLTNCSANRAFESALKVAAKYDNFVPQNLEPSNGASARQIRFLERAKVYWRTPGRAATRLKWAMIEHEAFASLVTRLVSYNDAMESILDRSSLDHLHVMQERSNLLVLQLTEKVSHLQALTQALQVKPSPAVTVTNVFFQNSFEAGAVSSTHLSSLAAFKIHNLSAPADAAGKVMYIESTKIDFAGTKLDDDRSRAVLHGKQVFVEWRTPMDGYITAGDRKIIKARLNQLAFLLNRQDKPAEFRSPCCIGYCDRAIDDVMQYGLVFEIPPMETASPNLRTLRDCFTNTRPPTLTARIALANSIVECLLCLHAVNWLHKGLRSDNVLFNLSPEIASSLVSLANPLISGFDFSRPDTADEITMKSTTRARYDYYKHPQLLRHSTTRSHKSHDIYALGIVLVELALWQPIETVMETILGKPLTTSQIPRIQERLVGAPFGDAANVWAVVAAQAGEVYAAVTKRCIEGGASLGIDPSADQADPVVNASLQRVFYDEVYLQLKSIRV